MSCSDAPPTLMTYKVTQWYVISEYYLGKDYYPLSSYAV
jgi:hypothetical protein